jgi:hypothetical protein
VIADEIEKESEAAGVKFIAHAVERVPGADAGVGDVGGDGVGRGDDVGWFPAGERAIELRGISGIFERDAAGFGAAAPDAHEPDDIETEFSDGIPGGVGNVFELDQAAEVGRHAFEPGPGIDFVEMRVGLGAKGGGDDSGKGHRGETSGGGSGCQWDGGTGGGGFGRGFDLKI